MPAEDPPFEDLIAGTQRTAVHLEMRDAYVPADPSFIAWQGGPPYDRTQREAKGFQGNLSIPRGRRWGNLQHFDTLCQTGRPHVGEHGGVCTERMVTWLARGQGAGAFGARLRLWQHAEAAAEEE